MSYKLKPEVKALWLEALRGDEYQQAEGALHRPDSGDGFGEQFCCLGVLCQLAIKDGVEVEVTGPSLAAVHYDGRTDLPPRVVVDWAFGEAAVEGLAADTDLPGSIDALWDVHDGTTTLAELNDAGTSFNQLADVIEEKF